MEQQYVYRQQKKLRCGYTTGTCAAAASMAAAVMLLSGEALEHVSLRLPKGEELQLEVREPARGRDWARCGIVKDSGDDPDVTNGIRIDSTVSRTAPEKGKSGWYDYDNDGLTLHLRGGVGIGTVTKPGLSCQVGKSAINPVPRQMIFSHVEQACEMWGCEGELWIELSALDGERLAEKTFNGKLGIRGGISILGTTGIVSPMSEEALLETIRLEIRQKVQEGEKTLILTPGNYGETFIQTALGLKLGTAVKCSNFIGASLDMAVEEGAKQILLIGHGGKLIKVAAGIMNTHSSVADGRMEILAAYGCCCGASAELIERILKAITVDQALAELETVLGLRDQVMSRVMQAVDSHLKRRVGQAAAIEALLFTNERGILGMTDGCKRLLEQMKAGE